MHCVIDASVVVKWMLDDPIRESHTDSARELVNHVTGRHVVWQPVHWLVEVAGVLSRLEPATVQTDITLLSELDWRIADRVNIMQRAAQLSTELAHHYFDTLYHAVALETDSVLITADQRYLSKARHLGNITELADWRTALVV
ncbi:MAG: type II toxin-antitoxin system VapC family toxin [Salinisphaera sp.]|jgi:predicted nucleic acid-binding protein|nr:type II toxin-antitoxin system VapC family toxin [Salinisphaera sp.]